jgi:ribose transport system permease protein
MTVDSTAPPRSVLGANLTADRRKVLYAFGAALLVLAVGGLLRDGFISRSNIQTILVIASFIGFVAAGQTFVILIGGIDFSVAWTLNAAAILLTTTSLGQNGRATYAVLLTLGMGLLVGLVNGLGVAYLAVPAVVMTLGMNGVLQGLTLGLSEGLTCASCTSAVPSAVRTTVRGDVAGVPAVLFLWLGVICLVAFLLSATTFGRRVYAVGNNPEASYLAGINTRLLTVALFMLSGMFAAMGGIVLVAYSGNPTLGLGDPYLLQSVAAIVIGGVSILGGRGLFLGTVAGAITLVTLLTLLRALQMPEYSRGIVYGVVILVILFAYGREREAR